MKDGQLKAALCRKKKKRFFWRRMLCKLSRVRSLQRKRLLETLFTIPQNTTSTKTDILLCQWDSVILRNLRLSECRKYAMALTIALALLERGIKEGERRMGFWDFFRQRRSEPSIVPENTSNEMIGEVAYDSSALPSITFNNSMVQIRGYIRNIPYETI